MRPVLDVDAVDVERLCGIEHGSLERIRSFPAEEEVILERAEHTSVKSGVGERSLRLTASMLDQDPWR